MKTLSVLLCAVLCLMADQGLARTVHIKNNMIIPHRLVKRQNDGSTGGSTGGTDGSTGGGGSFNDPQQALDDFTGTNPNAPLDGPRPGRPEGSGRPTSGESYEEALAALQAINNVVAAAFTNEDLSSLTPAQLQLISPTLLLLAPATTIETLTASQAHTLIANSQLRDGRAIKRIVFILAGVNNGALILAPDTGLLDLCIASAQHRQNLHRNISEREMETAYDEVSQAGVEEMQAQAPGFEALSMGARRALLEVCELPIDAGFFGPITGWTQANIRRLGGFILSGMMGMHASRIPLNRLDDVINLINQFRMQIDRMALQALLTKFIQAKGEPNTWTSDDLQLLGTLFTELPGHICGNIRKNVLRNTIEHIGRLDFSGKAECVRAIVDAIEDPNNPYDLTDIMNVMNLGGFIIARLSPEKAAAARETVSTAIANEVEGSEARRDYERLRTRIDFFMSSGARKDICDQVRQQFDPNGRPEQLSDAEVQEFLTSIPASSCGSNVLSAHDIRNMNNEGLCAAIDEDKAFAGAEFNRQQSKACFDGYRQCHGNIGAEQISNLGPACLGGASAETIRDMSDLADNMDVVREAAKLLSLAARGEVVRKLREEGSLGQAVRDFGADLAEGLSNNQIKDVSLADCGFEEGGDGSCGDVEFKPVQARNLFRRAKEERSGEMGTADFEQMGKAVVGCRHGDLTENVPTDEQLACVQTMSENGRGNMRPKQIRDIADKVVKPRLEALVEDGECILNGLSVEEAASMPEFMLQLPFETFQNETCTTEILEAALCSFGNLDDAEHMRNHPIHNRRELINIILNFYEIGETDPITSDVLNCLGGLACGLTPESIANIEEDALSDYISTSGQCCLRKLQRQAIVDRVMESTGATSIDDDAMVDYLDDLILFLAPDDTAAVDADTIYTKIVDENALDTVLDLSKEAKRLCRFDRKDEDGENTAEDEQRSALIEQAQDGSSTESKRRRRRETSSPCDLIARAEEYCTAFSAEEINSWTTDDFTCALDYMSTICSWSEDQLTALISQAKEVYGADVSQWSGSDLTSLGCIAQGLTHSELSTANIDSNSVVEALSQYDGWSEQQADAALTQYLTLTGKTADTLDATDLSSLMYFLAALDSSSVTQIDIDAFKDAIAVLSEITSFNHDQLDAFLDLCRQIYGDSDISNWLEEDIGEAGVFMAGTTANELSSLSEDQLAGIQALTFSIIRGEVLGALSAAQLENLGSDQVNYISDSTRDLLTAEQIEALETALYGNEVAPATDGSGATGLACSMVAMATSMMFVVFRI